MLRPLLALALLIALAATATPAAAQSGAKIVGNGTPGSCTAQALVQALGGGGTISFNCGGPATIPVATMIEIAAPTVIDGGGQVTLDAGGAGRILYLNKWERNNGLAVELRNLTLAGGRAVGSIDTGFGGCVYSRKAALVLSKVTMRGCAAENEGGALYVYGGRVSVSESSFDGNRARNGAAIYGTPGGATAYELIGRVEVRASSFTNNRTRRDGGAIYMTGSPLEVYDSTFVANAAEGVTGEPHAGLGGAIYLNREGARTTVSGTRFERNTAREGGGAFFADHDMTVSIAGSTFVANSSGTSGSEVYASGGAIGTARGSMSIAGSLLQGNRSNNGGAIYVGDVAMTISASRLIGNVGESGGGAIYNMGRLTMLDSLVRGNIAGTSARTGKQGGGIVSYSETQVTIAGSTIAENQAVGATSAGGGVWFGGTQLSITNSTIANNSAAGYGGGIRQNRGATMLNGVTIADNSAPSGGTSVSVGSGTVTAKNSILVGAGKGSNCSKALVDGGSNIQYPGTSCGTGIVAANPGLQPLAENGGPTPTRSLSAASPAIDLGQGCPALDQRGFSRNRGCDVGAVEFGSSGPPALDRRLYLVILTR